MPVMQCSDSGLRIEPSKQVCVCVYECELECVCVVLSPAEEKVLNMCKGGSYAEGH